MTIPASTLFCLLSFSCLACSALRFFLYVLQFWHAESWSINSAQWNERTVSVQEADAGTELSRYAETPLLVLMTPLRTLSNSMKWPSWFPCRWCSCRQCWPVSGWNSRRSCCWRSSGLNNPQQVPPFPMHEYIPSEVWMDTTFQVKSGWTQMQRSVSTPCSGQISCTRLKMILVSVEWSLQVGGSTQALRSDWRDGNSAVVCSILSLGGSRLLLTLAAACRLRSSFFLTLPSLTFLPPMSISHGPILT